MEGKYKALIFISIICLASVFGFGIYRSYTNTTTSKDNDDDDDDDNNEIPIDPIEDTTSPKIMINFPEEYDQFGNTPPNFTIFIDELNLDSSWYLIENGTHFSENTTFTGSSNVQIDQIAWDSVGNGTVSIEFYANDTSGNLGFNEIVVRKNTYNPIITILEPLTDDHFRKTSPRFDVIKGKGLYDIDSTWYSLYNGSDWSNNRMFTGTSEVINQTLWNNTDNGFLKLRCYINDTVNTITFDEVNISKICNVINHDYAHLEDLKSIPLKWINASKANLSISYGHTSHGSQLTTGMSNLDDFMGGYNTYIFGDDGGGDDTKLEFYDFSGNFGGTLTTTTAHDLGNPNDYNWALATEEYLDNASNPETNVIMWSWCNIGGHDIDLYISLMEELIANYSAGGVKGRTEETEVTFIFMTGHVDGNGIGGTNNLQNEKIRTHCIANNRLLFDFADIESYDPDDNYFLDQNVDDACDYDGGNWAREWQDTHNGVDIETEGGEWYPCSSAHSEPLNANLKAYACWYLFAMLAGWDGN